MPYLAFNLNDGNEFVFDILEERLSIGRDSKNDIVIDNTYISGFHAEFVRQPDSSYELIDLKSSNGTFLNGKRIERAAVKGGDKIRFGQLDSRFRERAPKGTAPVTEAKPVTSGKNQPAKTDGRRGDTESIPARDVGASHETGPIEPTRPPLARGDNSSTAAFAPPPPSMPISRPEQPAAPDPTLLKQAEELREEVAKLKQERELLRTENKKEALRRDEVRALEKTLEERQAQSKELDVSLGQLKAEAATIKAEVDKLTVKRREVSNLDSQLESTRNELTKAQADIATASKGLEALHKDADKARTDRLEASRQIEELRAQIRVDEERVRALTTSAQELETRSAELTRVLADSEKSEAEIKARQSTDLQVLDAQIRQKKAELKQLDSSLNSAQKAVQNSQAEVEAGISQLQQQKHSLEQQVAQLQGDLSERQSSLGGMDEKRSSLEAALAVLLASKQSSEAEIQSFQERRTTARQQYEAALAEQKTLEAQLADLKSGLSQTQVEAASRTAEIATANTQAEQQLQKAKEAHQAELAALAAQKEQQVAAVAKIESQIQDRSAALADLQNKVAQLESRSADLTNRLDDLSGKDAQLSNANVALKAVETHKAELAGLISQLTQERDSLTREMLSATEKGKAQHTLTEALNKRREIAEKAAIAAEEQQTALSTELGKVRENLRAAELTLETKQKETSEAQTQAEQIRRQIEQSTEQQRKIQAELIATQSELHQAQAALVAARADAEAKVQEAREAAGSHEQHRSMLSGLQTKIGGLETLLASLAASHTERQSQFSALESEQRTAAELLAKRQQETSAAEARLTELKEQTAHFEAKVKELQQTEKQLVEAKAALLTANLDLEKAQTESARLREERADHEKRLPGLRVELEKTQSDIALKAKDLAATETRCNTLAQQVVDFESRLIELKNAEATLAKTQAEITRLSGERETLNTFVSTLLTQRDDHEKILPGLKADVEILRTELQTLAQDKKNTSSALEKAQTERNAAAEQAATLRAEAATLDKLLQDKRSNLETETKTKLAEANQAEAKLRELTARVIAGEKRVQELSEIEKTLQIARQALQDNEKQRLTEEKSVSELTRQQDKLRKDITLLDDGLKAGQVQLADLSKKAKAEEARLNDLSARAEKAAAALQTAESKRQEAETAVTKARDEEKNLRKGIPTLTTEMAGLQAALAVLTRDRDEASQYVTRLNVTSENSNRKISELQQQISQLEEAQRIREERVMKVQTDVDNEVARFKAAQEQTRTAETALQELERQVKEARQKADAVRTQVQNQEAELSARLDRVQSLKVDEERLSKDLASRQQDIQQASDAFAEMQEKISTEESRVRDYTHVGGQILSLGAALASLETRQAETAKSLREAAERELALQVKINALQETFNRESAKVEELKKSRATLEKDLASYTENSQKQAASLQALEAEQKKRLAGLDAQLHEQTSLSERIKAELSGLHDRRAEFAQAEAQLRHWQEIEARLRGQLLELEEKHEIMRRGLSTEESTVVMFAHDIIKRIDLIDALTARYSSQNGGDVVTQLGTLRASFEDILLQHGISEFDIAAGTEVDTQLRKRIAVVDSVPGKQKPRVIETCRSGFIYSREEGHEVILRKVEVKTSSQ